MSAFDKMNKKLLASQVEDALMDDILNKPVPIGEKIPNEYELAEMYGVGRSTIRETVKSLVSKGILEVRQGSGTYVIGTDTLENDPLGFSKYEDKYKLALELFEVRLMLEPEIAALAAQKATEQDKEEIQDSLDKKKEGKGGHFWAGVLTGALIMALAVLLVVGVSAGIYITGRKVIHTEQSSGGGNGAPGITEGEKATKPDLKKVSSKMQMIQSIIDQVFLYDEDATEVEDYIYRGMMAGLNDPYSVYYNANDYKALQDSTNGSYSGIGAMISQNKTTGLCTIVKVFEGSPALEAGMKPGDIVYKVGDTLVAGESLDVLVSNYIKGKEGTQLQITVYRADSDTYVDMTLTRRKIEVPTVESRMLADNVGYVAVSEFDAITVEQFEKSIDELEKQGMKQLVIDLRSNPGGILDSAVAMVDYILPDDMKNFEKGNGKTLIVYTADKNGDGDTYTASDSHEVDMPIAILVNENSASASEVFTGALKDYKKAVVVGTTSYGKGIVQNLIPLGDGSAIKITTAHYYTPSGFDLHGKGIAPDVEVELDENLKSQAVVTPEEDNQVQAAVKALEKK